MSVHNFGTCEKKTTAQWRVIGDFQKKTCFACRKKSAFAIALRFSKRKSGSCVQT